MTTTFPVAATRVQVDSKAVYARLLASENIVVEHDAKAPTAYFDTVKRRLVLPCWEGMTESLYNMLVGHEVSHAIFSPKGLKWVEDVTAIDPKNSNVVKGFFNVVEDARIERLIKQKYPGLRGSFFDGYKVLIDTDKFQLNGKDISKMSLIDRINIHYKIGVFISVPFSAEELPLVSKVAETKTYEEALALTREIYEFVKGQIQDPKPEPQPQPQEDEDGETSTGTEEEESPEGNEGEGEGSSRNEGEDEDGAESDSASGADAPATDGKDKTVETSPAEAAPSAPVTDEVLKNAADQFNEKYPRNREIEYWDLPNFDFKKGIVSASEVNTELAKLNVTVDGLIYREFLRKNQNAITTLAQEFERRRAADVQRRTAESDSGTIDANRLWSYRVSEEIFASYQTVRDGQNHGLLFFIDWSGSMSNVLRETVDQAVCLAEFCRKANIPFEIYAFTDRFIEEPTKANAETVNEIVYGAKANGPWIHQGRNPSQGTNFRLINFLSSRLKGREYEKAAANLLYIADAFGVGGRVIPRQYYLGGTPLNAATMASLEIIPAFKRSNNLQIVHAIYLTDGGASDSIMGTNPNYDPNGTDYATTRKFTTACYGATLRKDGFSVKCGSGCEGVTESLVTLGRSLCPGTNFIAFDLTQKSQIAHAVREGQIKNRSKVEDMDIILKRVASEGFGTAANYKGYNQWFGLLTGREDCKDYWLVLGAKKITATNVANAMSGELSKVKGNRQFLARFAEIISKEAK